MAILESDDPLIPPSLASLGEPQLTNAIAQAQRMAESTMGAGRPLELTAFTEILPVSKVMQSAQLAYWPIASDPVPVIEIRQATTTVYGRAQGVSDWHTLSADEYILDADGKLNLQRGLTGSGFNRSALFNADEVRAMYTSGFDFSVSSYEVDQIKGAIASIMVAQATEQYQSGASKVSVDVDKDVKASVDYKGSASASSAAGDLTNLSGMSLREALLFLRRFQPRGILM